MPSNRDFSALLNQYLPLDLLKAEYMKRDYLMTKVTTDDSWSGGDLIIPFEGQSATSVEFNALPDAADISKYSYIRGSITSQPEAWSSLIFQHTDLMQHDGKIKESTFLKILPAQVDSMMTYFKMVMSVHLLGGPHFARATADGTAGGVLAVDRIDRFNLSQKIIIDDSNSSPVTAYVTAVSIDNKTVTVSATRGGSALDISAYTLGQSTLVFHPGAQLTGFTGLKSQLLSEANGGSASLFGQTKTAFPFLQCPNVSGSDVTATNILDKIFDAYTARMILGRGGKAPEVLMSFKHLGSILKLIQVAQGPYNVIPNSRKINLYGWQEIEISGVGGQVLKIVAIQEADDDVIYYVDWDSITFFSNGMFKRRKAPDGKEYFESRATTGLKVAQYKPTLIDLEARQGDRAQAYNYAA